MADLHPLDRVRDQLAGMLHDSAIELDHPLGPMTTYRVGGRAAAFIEVGSMRDLESIGQAVAACGREGHAPEVLVIGRGSNLLVSDAGFDGLALRLGDAFADVDVHGTRVRAGGAASLPVVARHAVSQSIVGFEWAVGIPGSIGGAVRMNAGGHGSDMEASVHRARVLDLIAGQIGDLDPAGLDFRYRGSAIGPHMVVVQADLDLATGDPAEGTALLSEIVRWRRENQPGGQNAGSVFTNPPGDSAGRLIDAAGLKGLRIGSAEVSPKHANFIQADPGGRADDIRELMREIVRRVGEHSGVVLEAETVMVGFPAGGGGPEEAQR